MEHVEGAPLPARYAEDEAARLRALPTEHHLEDAVR